MSNAAPSSADRALALVTLMNERGQLRVHDVAAEFGVAASTAHRLLAALREHGFAVQDRARVYHRGPALAPVSPPAPVSALRRAAAPILAALAHDTGETAQLMVLAGPGARFVDGVEGVHALRVALRVGIVLPAHLASGGLAMLAQLSRAELAGIYPSGLPLTPDAAGPDLATLRRRLATVRRRGYAVNEEQTEQGVNAIGACVRSAGGTPIAAVVLAAPSLRMPVRRLTGLSALVIDAAADVGVVLSRVNSAERDRR